MIDVRLPRLVMWAAVVIGALALALGVYYLTDIDLSTKPSEHVINYGDIRVVIRARPLGIGGNSEITVSEQTDNQHGHGLLIFKGIAELYFKKEDESTLTIYVASEGVPRDLGMSQHRLRIVIKELRNHDEIRDMEHNYKKYGLSKISIYPENSQS